MFTNILVGIDGSQASERALYAAIEMATESRAALSICHALQPETVTYLDGVMPGYHAVSVQPTDADVARAAEGVLSQARKIALSRGVPLARIETPSGNAAQAVLGMAEDIGADLIVTGRRGLGGLGAFLLGSTSRAIAISAHCAVLSVP